MLALNKTIFFKTKDNFKSYPTVGYLIRLTELNYLPDLNWALKSAGLPSTLFNGLNSSHNLAVLSKLVGVKEEILSQNVYRTDPDFQSKQRLRYLLYGKSISSFLISHKNSRICPVCLKKKNYLRRIWEFTPATVCVLHQCLLVDSCPKCQRLLTPKRMSVSNCSCGFDFRQIKPAKLPAKELRVTRQIYFLWGLGECGKESQLGLPLRNLSFFHFIKILLFFACFWGGVKTTDGRNLIARYSNKELHNLLNLTSMTFDDFPENFFVFLDWIKHQNYPNFETNSSKKRSFKHQYNEVSPLEVFRRELIDKFDLPQFDIFHTAYEKYFEFGLKGFVPRSLFYSDPIILESFYLRLITSQKRICAK